MVQEPGGVERVLDVAKIRNYLLSHGHPVGGMKAAFFREMGYEPGDWRMLEADLLALASQASLEVGRFDEYGCRYQQRGVLIGPNGHSARVVTVWIRRTGESALRFVTAYPE